MHDFIPPYPERPKEPLSALATLHLARRNFLAIWEDRCFEWEVFSNRLISRRLFVCNSPDTVELAFIENHESFERKSPQMRHALAPLLGDGLFISDGEVWRRRRRLVAPIIHVSRLPLFAPLMVQAALETAERWAELPEGTQINALTEMAALTAEIICRTVFGRELGAARAAEIITAFSEY
jgi:cytochrome P450